MLSTRQWVVEDKPHYPGEVLVHAAVRPFTEGREVVQRFAKPADAAAVAQSRGLTYHVRSTMPPEVADWFDFKLQQAMRHTPPVRWGPVDPLTALTTRASRFTQEAALEDLQDLQKQLKLPPLVQKMQRQLFAAATRGLTAQDLDQTLVKTGTKHRVTLHDPTNMTTNLSLRAGVSWHEVEQDLKAFAEQWLEERPKLAERLTHDPRPVVRPGTPRQSLRPATVSV